MKNQPSEASHEKEVLRVALDAQASGNYKKMVDRMKSENPYVKVQPSAFVSFLVSDFYAAYFEKDLGFLLAEFFDSQSYYESQLKLAKSEGSFDVVMSEALSAIKRIKGKKRGKLGRKPNLSKGTNATNHEEI